MYNYVLLWNKFLKLIILGKSLLMEKVNLKCYSAFYDTIYDVFVDPEDSVAS